MFFKNAQAFRVPANWGMSSEVLAEQLQKMAFQPCPSNEPMSVGWVAPVKDGGLVHVVGGQWLLACQLQKRDLSSATIKEEVGKRAEAFAQENGHKMGRKQLRELKERVTEELLPRAFTKTLKTLVWVDPVNGWLVIDASSQKKAEGVIELLRKSLEIFPLKPVRTQLSPVSAMADWLASDEAPAGFTVDCDCELKAPDESKQTVRFVRHPLDSQSHANIKEHLAAGKLPTRLALTWEDRISFVLTDKLELLRLTFLDILQDEASQSAETADEQANADFAIMTAEMIRLLNGVVEVLGGESPESQA